MVFLLAIACTTPMFQAFVIRHTAAIVLSILERMLPVGVGAGEVAMHVTDVQLGILFQGLDTKGYCTRTQCIRSESTLVVVP